MDLRNFTATLPSLKGVVKSLFFTHNTLISILYTMMMSTDSRYIRSLDLTGNLINRGAQFRNGLDSQYGDVVFVMKDNFWLNLNGSHYHTRHVTERVIFGHFYKRDFIEFSTEANRNLINRWLEKDARFYDFRPETNGLNGKECKRRQWNVSWCNLQIHLGQNVDFSYVEKMYVPAWLLHDTATLAQIEAGGVNTTFLKLLVSNNLPRYATGDHAANPLNGLFHLYGPSLARDHYHRIEKERGKMKASEITTLIYTPIVPLNESYRIQTHRRSSSSSIISLHERAFIDLQIKYMADLVKNNMTKYVSTEYTKFVDLYMYPT